MAMKTGGSRFDGVLVGGALLFAVGFLLLWLSEASYGQLRAAPAAGEEGFTVAGNLQVRVHLPEFLGEPWPEKVLEGVTRVQLLEEWAVIELVENDEETTLMIPREKLFYVKAWKVKK